MLWVLALLLEKAYTVAYGNYKFFKNYGPAFYDYGGTKYHALNGDVYGDDPEPGFFSPA